MTCIASNSSDGWIAVDQVLQDLHVSRTTLYRLRKEGLLKPGIHYLRTTPGRKSRMLWSPAAIRQTMAGWS